MMAWACAHQFSASCVVNCRTPLIWANHMTTTIRIVRFKLSQLGLRRSDLARHNLFRYARSGPRCGLTSKNAPP